MKCTSFNVFLPNAGTSERKYKDEEEPDGRGADMIRSELTGGGEHGRGEGPQTSKPLFFMLILITPGRGAYGLGF